MAPLYARKALLGLLTPQANTTAEAEISLLLPPGHGLITARLTSDCPKVEDRLTDYFARIGPTAAQFANAPLTAIGFACTGASYLVGAAAETQALAAPPGVPVITAGQAIASALRALDARSIAIASPYGPTLTNSAATYWTDQGFTITRIETIPEDRDAFHPIYAHAADKAETATRRLLDDPAGASVIVLLGTGLPTLPTLARHADSPRPVLSSNLCLAWAMTQAASAEATNLHGWLRGDHWRARLADTLG